MLIFERNFYVIVYDANYDEAMKDLSDFGICAKPVMGLETIIETKNHKKKIHSVKLRCKALHRTFEDYIKYCEECSYRVRIELPR